MDELARAMGLWPFSPALNQFCGQGRHDPEGHCSNRQKPRAWALRTPIQGTVNLEELDSWKLSHVILAE